MSAVDSKTISKEIYRKKMQLAIDNFLEAEHEGAEHLAPETYAWAKAKFYDNKKIILMFPQDEKKIEGATDDAAAAAATLLATVREVASRAQKSYDKSKEYEEKEAITNLVNEGGPVV